MNISPDQTTAIPLHDAELLNLTIEPTEKGSVNVLIHVKLHPDEELDLLKIYGIGRSDFYLIFNDCIQVKSDILGLGARPETIGELNIVKESDLIEKLLFDKMTFNYELVHFRLIGNKGSKLDVIASKVMITKSADIN